MPNRLAKARALLLARRRELEALSGATKDDRAPVELDQSKVGRLSRMDALQGQAMAQASEDRRAAEIARIAAALKRVDTGEYGSCVTCGDAIAEKRLAIDPAAAVCIACAKGAKR